MRIGVLGAGNMAGALGEQWARAGHEVLVGARDPGRAAALAERIGHGARSGTFREAAEFGEVVLLAVWYEGVADVLDAAGPLEGRVLVDCTNATGPPDFTLKTPSVAGWIAERVPGARVVKAFNLCHESVWRLAPPPVDVPLCGDAEAVAVVAGLVRDMGCEPLHGGGLERAGQLEATAAFALGVYFGGPEMGDPRGMFPPIKIATEGVGPIAAGPTSR
ncbi:NAD(P)-binding domain-containing protein [Spirillospora sp. NPDC029432]|uniref:NADPH-dependent F420 reductase n=1 Tax=Spirillospora sp. NPDC029432 TaxID=3154599 RepID=UPI003451DC30